MTIIPRFTPRFHLASSCHASGVAAQFRHAFSAPRRSTGRPPRITGGVAAGVLALVLSLVLTASAWAGIEIRSTTTDHAVDPPRRDRGSTLISEGSLRTHLEIAQGENRRRHSTVFRAAFNDFLIIDHQDKTFTLFDQAAIEDLQAQLAYSMAQIDRKLAEMPIEQRRRFIESLRADAPKATQVVATADVEEKGGFTCRRHEVRAGDELVREVWVASWDEIPEGAAVRTAMENLETFLLELNAAFESVTSAALGGAKIFDLGENPVQDLSRLGGFPMLTRNYVNGQLTSETAVEGIEQRELSQADFIPPPSYERRRLDGTAGTP